MNKAFGDYIILWLLNFIVIHLRSMQELLHQLSFQDQPQVGHHIVECHPFKSH